MLEAPFGDSDVSRAMALAIGRELSRRHEAHQAIRLHDLLTNVLYLALQGNANHAHGRAVAHTPEFKVGSALVAYELAERALHDIDDYFAHFLDGGGAEETGLLEEIQRFGRLALARGRLRQDGMLEIPTDGPSE